MTTKPLEFSNTGITPEKQKEIADSSIRYLKKQSIQDHFRNLDIQLSDTRHTLSDLKKLVQNTDLKSHQKSYLKELIRVMENNLKETHNLKERLYNELVYKEII